MKYTLCLTQNCNLACDYCYIHKRPAAMAPETALNIVDFMYRNTPPDDTIKVGFFGGEPLLEFELLTAITEMIERHPSFSKDRILLSIATNGTIVTGEILDFIKEHDISLGFSCDGPPEVHDRHRRQKTGGGTGKIVEKNICLAVETLPAVIVNAVHHPDTVEYLAESVNYFKSLGITNVYLNPDYSANWTMPDMAAMVVAYKRVGELYTQYYLEHEPIFISLIDYKIAVLLRKGYRPEETCRMGVAELAFTPEGRIFPCERLIGDGLGDDHCIGHLDTGIDTSKMACHTKPGRILNIECMTCSLKKYCMNWCGCSNFMASGFYNRVNSFVCASEKAAIGAAFEAFRTIEKKLGPTFYGHLTLSDKQSGLCV